MMRRVNLETSSHLTGDLSSDVLIVLLLQNQTLAIHPSQQRALGWRIPPLHVYRVLTSVHLLIMLH